MFFTEEQHIESKVETEETLKNRCEIMYGMGSTYLLSDEECEYEYLAREIAMMEDKEGLEEVKNSENKKEAYEDWMESLKDEIQKLVFMFTRKDGGYIKQINNHLKIDFEKFDDSDIKNKREKIKIIYFLYTLKPKRSQNGGISDKEHIKNILGESQVDNILKMISDSSMENVDNSILGMKTYNGETIKKIREELGKEIKEERKEKMYQAKLIYVFFDFFLKSQNIIADYYASIERNDIAYSFLESMRQSLSFPKKIYEEYELSPIEMFYFRIIQFEQLGNIKDVLFINSIKNKSNYNVPKDMIVEMKKFAFEKIAFEKIDNFIESNAAQIATYVFLKKDVDYNDLKKLRRQKDKTKIALAFFDRTNFEIDASYGYDKLLIISTLQSIILDEEDEFFNYTFSGYRKYMNKIKVGAALKKEQPVDALKAYWTRKITDHWYANIGRYELRCNFRETENISDNLLMDETLMCTGPDSMESLLEDYIYELADPIMHQINYLKNILPFDVLKEFDIFFSMLISNKYFSDKYFN